MRTMSTKNRLIAGLSVLTLGAGVGVAVQSAATQAATPTGASACATLTMPVFQRVNPATEQSLLTPNPTEAARAGTRYGFTTDLGTAFLAGGSAATDLVAVHRLYNATTGDFFWTAGANERATAVSKYGYVDQKVNFFARQTAAPCATPVHRMRKGGLHRTVVEPTVLAMMEGAGWQDEGISFFAVRANTPTTPGPSVTPTRAPVTPTATPTATATPTITPTTPNSAGFVHPGVSVSRTQLDFVKVKIKAGQEPWASAFKALQGNFYGKMTRKPAPVPIVKCATAGGLAYTQSSPGMAEVGCDAQTEDAVAAYNHALQWYFTGDEAQAQKSIEFLNAWGRTLKTVYFDEIKRPDGGYVYANGILQAAWSAETITRAAEIMRYTYTPSAGKTAFDVPAFSSMLRNALLPKTIDNWKDCCANWLLSTTDATISMGVFLDDRAVYENGIGDWRKHVPAAIYLNTDKPTQPQLAGLPLPAPGTNYDKPNLDPARLKAYWKDPVYFINGMSAETCRDLGHTIMGFEALASGAETARIQGIDLWGEQKTRIVAGLEFNARLLNAAVAGDTEPPSNPCGRPIELGHNPANRLGWEIAYNHYANRLGVDLPQTKLVVDRSPAHAGALHMVYETLTYSGTP